MRSTVSICLLIATALIFSGCQRQQTAASNESSGRLRVTLPDVVLRDVPVSSVRIDVLTNEGEVDTEFAGLVSLSGVRIVRSTDGATDTDEPTSVRLTRGSLEFTTQLAAGERVYVSNEFAVELDGTKTSGNRVFVAGFWSLLPPVIAIVLAILLKDVYVALLAAVYSGALVLAGWDPILAFTNMLDPTQKGFVAQAADSWNMQVIAFTLFLGAMIQVMSDSGGTQALVSRFSGQTATRERGQLMTWFMGLLVFFDDYANTMLVGGAMRPVTDRLRISREKLAFIIDSTAAPIAGLAIVSTWVGVEVGYIGDGFETLGMDKGVSYTVFLKTLPYRFYPLFLIGFVMLIAATGRDYGPMLTVERAAFLDPPSDTLEPGSISHGSMWYAIVPVAVLVGWIIVGFLLNFGRDDFDSVPLLLHGGFMAALSACLIAKGGGALNIPQCGQAWTRGMTEMFPAIIVLVLAWSVSSICKPDGLNTAGYIIEQIGDGVALEWMPTLAFVISGMVAFAIGSSYTTMGLLIPLFMSLVGYMLFGQGGIEPTSDHPLMLSTIGAILAGSIFGDHCSPISDTTVLSSAGAKCDHLKHVATQMPYALSVGLIAIVFGYLPAGYGVNPWLMLPIGLVACFIVVRFAGKRIESM